MGRAPTSSEGLALRKATPPMVLAGGRESGLPVIYSRRTNYAEVRADCGAYPGLPQIIDHRV